MAKADALNLVSDFKKRIGAGKFYSLSRAQIADGLTDRINDPGVINQAAANLCGPASLLFNLAIDRPEMYAKFGIDLFEIGEAHLKDLKITAGDDLRAAVPARGSIHPTDWITMASIRDSENWFGFSYSSTTQEASAITWPNEMEKWFTQIGYTKVINKASKWFTQDRFNAEEASRLYDKEDYHVVLLLNDKILQQTGHKAYEYSAATPPTHYVVLRSTISFSPTVKFTVYSWGNKLRQVPQIGEALTVDEFLGNYFGFIACKY